MDLAKGRPLVLDGEWAAYPSKWITGPRAAVSVPSAEVLFQQVPGSGMKGLGDGEGVMGYGSYRLKVLVDPKQELTYSMRIASIRSSYEVYVNGRLLAKLGQPGETKETTRPANLPRTVSFAADENGEIDIIVQAANFTDIRGGGIIRSLKFGSEQAVYRETLLSNNLQQFIAILFLLQAIYAVILYAIGNRDKRLLNFSLIALTATAANLMGSDEKLLNEWIPLTYTAGFRVVNLSLVAVTVSLLQVIVGQTTGWKRKAFLFIQVACSVFGIVLIFVPVESVIRLMAGMVLPLMIAVFSLMGSMIRTVRSNVRENLLLGFACIALLNHFIWWAIGLVEGWKTPYYPFDLVLATGCLSALWFWHYLQVHLNNRSLLEKMKQEDRRKDEFLANTSHELRNPLHSMLSLSQAVLEREQGLTHQSEQDMQTVLAIGRRMTLLLNDLLDLMSLREGIPRLQRRPVRIAPIAAGVVDMLRFLVAGKPVRIVFDLPEDLPAVYADEERLTQILFNLVHNAIKFTDEGTITLRAKQEEDRVWIAIADTGIGMEEETLQRVFAPYEQGQANGYRTEGGLGLGLGICDMLVKLHDGKLEARSSVGQGSEFRFSLPVSVVAESPVQPEARAEEEVPFHEKVPGSLTAVSSREREEEPPITEVLKGTTPPRLLVVDDDPVNLSVLETILAGEGYEVTLVTSGEQALAELAGHEFDLLLSDVMMPQMSGYELTRIVREQYPMAVLPILLLTARSRAEDRATGFRAGANDYVTKPVEPQELRSRVRALTEVKQSAQEQLRLEAAWLQAQIQPHFLFNTLSAISILSEVDPERMRRLLGSFSDYLHDRFRYQGKDELIPLEEELSMVRTYLAIEQERFEDRLQVVWELEEDGGVLVPLLSIQPLVENAVRHGAAQRTRGGMVRVRTARRGEGLEITIEDNGLGMEEAVIQRLLEGKPGRSTGGVGLLNTDRRLKKRWGKGLHIVSRPGAGTAISFTVGSRS
ncbi:ATP-binding protein [Gorillibacterium sp. CAU 1737]|uniref:hybrid sensor histidine kinase/response regulator n=1 Tax=Gorillibacterium sp. CAU 1737 TaxID=3140362 RepID=UPI0032601110